MTRAPITFLAIWMPTVPRLPPAPMISTVSPALSAVTWTSRFHAVHTWRSTPAARAIVAAAILRADIERHETRGGVAIAGAPAAHLRPDCIDNAGAIDARNERQCRATRHFLAGAQADVE